jgi:two-component system, NtrC family, response regulator AtoC
MTPAASHLRVLVVEDEALIRWSIAETLGHEGHTVIEASDASSAMQTLTDGAEAIDHVVLLDYRLPDSNDLQLLTNVRRLRPESAVVMMTAYGIPEVTSDALDLGAYRVVTKPFDMHAPEPLILEAHNARSSHA